MKKKSLEIHSDLIESKNRNESYYEDPIMHHQVNRNEITFVLVLILKASKTQTIWSVRHIMENM